MSVEAGGATVSSHASSRTCPLPQQLQFKPEALQLQWFLLHQPKQPRPESFTKEERDNDRQACSRPAWRHTPQAERLPSVMSSEQSSWRCTVSELDFH